MKTSLLKPSIDHLMWLLVAVLYTPVFKQLYTSRWENIDYTHAYLILPVSLFLVWHKRKQIAEALAQPQSALARRTGPLLLGLGCFFFFFGWRMDYLMVSTVSLIPVLYGIVLYRYNSALAKLMTFPILYLLLLVPPPLGILDAITMPMRQLVTVLSASFLDLFYTVKREGLMMSVDHAQIYIGAPCSGFRSLISMFALALIYVHLIKLDPVRKRVLIAAVLPLALFGNFVRVITLCLITYYFGKEAGEGFFHGFSGMVIFVIMMMGLMGLERMLSEGIWRKRT